MAIRASAPLPAATPASPITPEEVSEPTPAEIFAPEPVTPPVAEPTPATPPLSFDAASEDIPDWLRPLDAQAIADEVSEELAPEPPTPPAPTTPEGSNLDDLPDWLKAGAQAPAAPAEETSDMPIIEESPAPIPEKKPRKPSTRTKKAATDETSEAL